MKFGLPVKLALMAASVIMCCLMFISNTEAACRWVGDQLVCDSNYGQSYTSYRAPRRQVSIVRSSVPMQRARVVERRGLFGRRAVSRSVSTSNGSSGQYQSQGTYGSSGSYNTYAPTSYVEVVEEVEVAAPEDTAVVPDASGPDATASSKDKPKTVTERLLAIEERLTNIESDLLVMSLQRSEADRKTISLDQSLVKELVKADNSRWTVASRN